MAYHYTAQHNNTDGSKSINSEQCNPVLVVLRLKILGSEKIDFVIQFQRFTAGRVGKIFFD